MNAKNDSSPESFSTQHWPTEIRLKKQETVMEVDFDDGSRFALPAELLRVESPSAEVQGHSQTEKKTVPRRSHVGILGVEPVGHYAIRIMFDELPEPGIYSWSSLSALGGATAA